MLCLIQRPCCNSYYNCLYLNMVYSYWILYEQWQIKFCFQWSTLCFPFPIFSKLHNNLSAQGHMHFWNWQMLHMYHLLVQSKSYNFLHTQTILPKISLFQCYYHFYTQVPLLVFNNSYAHLFTDIYKQHNLTEYITENSKLVLWNAFSKWIRSRSTCLLHYPDFNAGNVFYQEKMK